MDVGVATLRVVRLVVDSAAFPDRARRLFAVWAPLELEAGRLGGLGGVRITHAPYGRVGHRMDFIPRPCVSLVPIRVLR